MEFESDDLARRPYLRLATYNKRANERIYAAAAALDDDRRKQNVGAFFGSLHGTLNHILVADRIWMARFQALPAPAYRLDEELFADFAALRAARDAEDARLLAFARQLTAAWLAEPHAYHNTRGDAFSEPRDVLILHMFNHQTHHRGHAHTVLSLLGEAPPSLDMHVLLR
jgi:uncharacterized damage-inducible protein DinB